jgi:nitrogen-specific signal transduction histidine kinase
MDPINEIESREDQAGALRHDIKNQLSGITLALAQLRYEIANPTDDCLTYLDMIEMSCNRINELVKHAG